MIDGASFVDTFRTLDRTYDFTPRGAFSITMRIYRGGGLLKDVIYLRGFQKILEYLGRGKDLDPVLVGKIAFENIPIIKELRLRHVLRAPPLRPRYLNDKRAAERLARLQADRPSILSLVEA